MGIEKDILQSKFRNEYQKAAVNLIYTYNWLQERMKVFFSTHDITAQQFNILRILRGANAALSTLQIRQRMLDKMSDTSRIVDRLVIKGLVKKKLNKTDKRLVDVVITEKGKKVLQQIDQYEQEMDEMMKALDLSETKALNQLLDKLRANDKY